MYIEQERKFLVSKLPDYSPHDTRYVLQGYMSPGSGVRVRFLLNRLVPLESITPQDVQKIIVGVKRDTTDASQRLEEEHVYDVAFFDNFLATCATTLLKTRHEYMIAGVRWEIDVYHGPHEGLMVAEVEYEGSTMPPVPGFCGPDVTDDLRYRNENLAYPRSV